MSNQKNTTIACPDMLMIEKKTAINTRHESQKKCIFGNNHNRSIKIRIISILHILYYIKPKQKLNTTD